MADTSQPLDLVWGIHNIAAVIGRTPVKPTKHSPRTNCRQSV